MSKRTVSVNIRLTPEEYQTLLGAANRFSMQLAPYIRSQAISCAHSSVAYTGQMIVIEVGEDGIVKSPAYVDHSKPVRFIRNKEYPRE